MAFHIALLLDEEEIFLNDEDVDGIDQIKLTFKVENEDEEPTLSFSAGLTFTGEAYELLYRRFITDGGGNFLRKGGCDFVKVFFYDDCCGGEWPESNSFRGWRKVFSGKLETKTMDWCFGECKITADVIQDDEYSKAVNCLKSTRVYSNRVPFEDGINFTDYEHPFVKYCVEMRPNFIQSLFIFLLIIIGLIVIPIIWLLGIVVTLSLIHI